MKFGLITPLLTLVPKRHAEWEQTADVEILRRIVTAADRLGFHHLTCSDHVAIPTDVAAQRGSRYFDPFSTLGFVAALTERIRLLTHVLVLPYYHPLEVAKRLGTLDHLSAGRVIAGVGVGSLRQEFDLLGVEFDQRGPVYEDALRALRAALGRRQPEYSGSHFQFSGVVVDPCAQQVHLPIWLGGRTLRSLRRALRYGDGWDPFGLSLSELDAMLARARAWPEWSQRDGAFDLAFAPERPFELGSESSLEAARATVRRYAALGATGLNLQFVSRSPEHFTEQLELFALHVATGWA